MSKCNCPVCSSPLPEPAVQSIEEAAAKRAIYEAHRAQVAADNGHPYTVKVGRGFDRFATAPLDFDSKVTEKLTIEQRRQP